MRQRPLVDDPLRLKWNSAERCDGAVGRVRGAAGGFPASHPRRVARSGLVEVGIVDVIDPVRRCERIWLQRCHHGIGRRLVLVSCHRGGGCPRDNTAHGGGKHVLLHCVIKLSCGIWTNLEKEKQRLLERIERWKVWDWMVERAVLIYATQTKHYCSSIVLFAIGH